MPRSYLIPALLVGLGIQMAAVPAVAQRQSYSGAFEREYPEAYELLQGFRAAQAEVLERLYSSPGMVQEMEGAIYADLEEQVREGEDDDVRSLASRMPRFAGFAGEIAQILDHAYVLQQDIYDIYADARVTDKNAAVEAAVDRYLARPELALSPTKKSMSAMEDHSGHVMPGMNGVEGFQGMYPKSNALLWASNWLQLALYDPLMYFPSEEQKKQGVENTIARFYEMLESTPETAPREMPTPAAITPELVRLHPRAAAILHNVHMLQDEIVNVLSDASTSDKRTAMNESLEMFRDPEHMTVSDYDWIVFSLRNGIFFQGGPAIGRIDRPERNVSHAHGGGVMPGMGGPGGVSTEPQQDATEPDPHAGH